MVRDHRPAVDLAVDLDGALLKTDTLHEGLLRALFTHPVRLLVALLQIFRGRAAFKAALVEFSLFGVGSYPVRQDFLAYLQAQKAEGRRLHLVSAADHQVAEAVAGRLGLFESVLASHGADNLKGPAKRDKLCETFPGGFSYAGDNRADLAVFAQAQTLILAGASSQVADRARRLKTPVEAEFPPPRVAWRTLFKALRLHQWAKNLLIFVPLLLSGEVAAPDALARTVLGFLVIGCVASGSYLVNDLSDLDADRRHATKARRPFAAGDLPVLPGFAAAVLIMLAGLAAGFILRPAFGGLLLIYLATTLTYTFWLKRVALLDVTTLAALYALRVGMGASLAGVALSDWLLVFSLFFFLSLSLAKRHVELVRLAQSGGKAAVGRGYLASDAVLTLPLGVAAAMTSLLVMVLFLVFEAFPPQTYPAPAFLWAAPALVFLWLCRIWLLSARGALDDDPVSFAVKDKASLAMGLILVLCTLLAVFAPMA